MKREKVSDLYFAKCRHCIMDIINSYSVDGKEIIPRPDYVDYYTIVKKTMIKHLQVYLIKIRYLLNILIIKIQKNTIVVILFFH